jgi:hypothetical protein
MPEHINKITIENGTGELILDISGKEDKTRYINNAPIPINNPQTNTVYTFTNAITTLSFSGIIPEHADFIVQFQAGAGFTLNPPSGSHMMCDMPTFTPSNYYEFAYLNNFCIVVGV